MDFSLNEEQRMIQQAARDYARRELVKDAILRDEKSLFPTKHIKNMSELGFIGMMVDPKYDGAGMDTISYAIAIEELSKIDPSVGVILSVTNSLVAAGIEKFGTGDQKQKYLRPLANGNCLGAFLLSEPESGSDATSQRTTAEDKGSHFELNGIKNWITNASSASIYIVLAQADSSKKSNGINAFIVESDAKGIQLGPKEQKMGMRSSDTHSVIFTNVKVPKESRLGKEGEGFKMAMQILEGGRIGVAAQATGIAGGAYDIAKKYATERKTFGTQIINHQAIGFKLADMATRIESAKMLTFKAAWLKDQNQPYGTASAMAKLYASETAMHVTTEAVQVLGGYGYVKEYHVERLMRDAKLTQIYEGTSEIQKIVISRAIKKEMEGAMVC